MTRNNSKSSVHCKCDGKQETESSDETVRKTMRPQEEYKSLMNRLCRIEGQIKGLKKMLENDAYCPDILIQVSAVNAALNAFNRNLLSNHIKTCVLNDVRNGSEEKVDELVKTLQKLMK